MSAHITILADNHVERGRGLLAEHGLSMLVETDGTMALFDTGQSDVCLRNSQRLGVDIGGVRTVVLSHGHYDHGEGLPALLNLLKGAEVVAHPDAFAPKYARRQGKGERYVGLSYHADELGRGGAQVRLDEHAREIGRGLLTTGPIPRETDFEPSDPAFCVKADGEFKPDDLRDEQALVARSSAGLVVLLGCAHAGVINALRHAVKLTGDDRIRTVIGGLHLAGASEERVAKTVAALRELDVRQVVACHCTGFAPKVRLHAAFGERFVNGSVGLRIAL